MLYEPKHDAHSQGILLHTAGSVGQLSKVKKCPINLIKRGFMLSHIFLEFYDIFSTKIHVKQYKDIRPTR